MGDPQVFIEEHVMVDAQGKLTELRSQAVTHGYLDWMRRESAKTARYRDWKTTQPRWESRDEFESHAYALMCKAFFPGVTRVIAELCFLRSGNIIRTIYEWDDDDKSCLITYNDGDQEQLWSETNPILEYILVRIDEILATNPFPRPGSHCQRMYGRPCQFFGKNCPLNHQALLRRNVPEIVSTPRYSEALASLFNDEPMNDRLASDGLYAIHQMEHFLGKAKKKIKQWVANNGPITIGNTKYGWKKKIITKADIPFVIQTLMDHEVPIEDWDRVLSASKSSIRKLPQGQYGEVRDILETFSLTRTKVEQEFGELKPDNNEEEE